MERDRLVAASRAMIVRGSHSFSAASRLFEPRSRERAWLLYAWCRAADDLTDGQELGHAAKAPAAARAAQAKLESLTWAALDGEEPVPVPFAALRLVVRETAMPRGFIADHLAGFALDAAGWRPRDQADLLRYCYHVAGTVGCMMAVVMGVRPDDADTIDRACDLGLAFQLANIARDVVPDARAGRCYLPADWLAGQGLGSADLADPRHRPDLAVLAARLVRLARGYRASARVGAARLSFRSRLAVLAAEGIYGSIGEKVASLGEHAWDRRVRVHAPARLALVGSAAVRCTNPPSAMPRGGLWTRPDRS